MRHWRTGDSWLDSMRAILNGDRGFMIGPDDEALAFMVNTTGYSGMHLAVFPEALVTPMILAGTRLADVVLDPFCGSGTVEATAYKLGRKGIGIDLSMAYMHLSVKRARETPMGLPLTFSNSP